jgi:hypothetical protein
MNYRYFAVVKMDNYEITGSTGGVVVCINYWPTNDSDRVTSIFDITLKWGAEHRLIPCHQNVKVGWIYTDKTNIFVDSNYSTNT